MFRARIISRFVWRNACTSTRIALLHHPLHLSSLHPTSSSRFVKTISAKGPGFFFTVWREKKIIANLPGLVVRESRRPLTVAYPLMDRNRCHRTTRSHVNQNPSTDTGYCCFIRQARQGGGREEAGAVALDHEYLRGLEAGSVHQICDLIFTLYHILCVSDNTIIAFEYLIPKTLN